MEDRPLVVVDIFCGAGGLSAGFQSARARWQDNRQERFQIAYGIDIDEDAIKTFREVHFPGMNQERLGVIAPCKDIRDVSAGDILRAIAPANHVDVLIGGPNCQGVSAAGLRNPDDDRNFMLLAFIRLVRELRPSWFVMENVPGLTHANNRELLASIFEQLESTDGYNVAADVLLAANYGVPQLRYRLFVVGTNTGAPIRFPPPTHFLPSTDTVEPSDDEKPKVRTVRDAIFDLMPITPRLYDKHALPNGYLNGTLPANHYCMQVSSINKDRIAAIKQGEDWRNMPVRLLPERYFATRASDQKGSYGRLLWDWPAYTITNLAYNVTSGPFTHPEYDRPLSVREAARLQSFSDEHVFFGKIGSQYRQVGNAVPPMLAQAVAEGLLYCHWQQEEAKSWGQAGRLNLQVIRDSIEGKRAFPVVTPRCVHPLFDRRTVGERFSAGRADDNLDAHGSVWDKGIPQDGIDVKDAHLLHRLATQPGNYRAAQRAKVIEQFLKGVPKEEIIHAVGQSEASIRKWVDGYVEAGLDGWRAYHTTPERIAGGTPELAERIKEAIVKVRQIQQEPSTNGMISGTSPKRLYMNDYLLQLVKRFGDRSVSELIEEVNRCLGHSVGTVYVGDLLAIRDILETQ